MLTSTPRKIGPTQPLARSERSRLLAEALHRQSSPASAASARARVSAGVPEASMAVQSSGPRS